MEGVYWLYIVMYGLFAFIVFAFVSRLAMYARIPTHLRWELYPLAGEKDRPWGGSYLEEPEWWTKPLKEKSFLNELKFMGTEALYFKEYFHLNRNYWYFVYPFHVGIFTFLVFCVLLLVGALAMLGGVAVSADSVSILGKLVYYATLISGAIGFVMSSLGSISLIIKRKMDSNLNPYTRRIEYFNLVFVLVVFLTGLFSWLIYDFTFTTARMFVKGLITFMPAVKPEPLIITHILLLVFIAAYMPFTNMMHFFAKWFTYHKIRWDDEPNLRGSKLQNKLVSVLSQPLSWSAPHIESTGRWCDLAQVPAEELKPRVKKVE